MLSLLTDRRHKNSRLGYYLKNLWLASLPGWWHRREGRRLLALAGSPLRPEWSARLDYYARLPECFEVGADAVQLNPRLFADRRNYAFDLARPLRRVDPMSRFDCRFGDQTEPPERPTFVKARRVDETSGHSVLLKLNRIRHFVRASDRTAWADKRPTAVWRGIVNRPNRARFLARWQGHACCDAGATRGGYAEPATVRPRLSIGEQLQHRFIVSLEGNDVATNLKWILSSNSLCLMPRPTKETWFMEGRLEPGVHYIELRDDFEDLEECIARWSRDRAAAERMLVRAHQWCAQFEDAEGEDILELLVVRRYLERSGQLD
jgi:hypothetical protein